MGDTRLTSVALAFDGDFFVLAFYFSLDFGWQPYAKKRPLNQPSRSLSSSAPRAVDLGGRELEG
jgi:hypothetical protein